MTHPRTTTFPLRALCAMTLLATAATAPLRADYDGTLHSEFQAVDASGATDPSDFLHPLTLRGIVLNDPADMLDPTPGYAMMGGMWQVFLQTDVDGDFGGTALWMGQNVGRIWGADPPDLSYTDDAWLNEMDRLNNPAGGGTGPLREGDVIEVTAATSLFHNGKHNVNEGHLIDESNNFTITRIQNGSLPTPSAITLADVKDTDDTFIFDATRATGAEHYQGTLVELTGLSLDGDWGGAGDTVTVSDGNGRTFPLLFGRDPGFDLTIAPESPFNVVGIFDQEDPGTMVDETTTYYHGNYRLWVMEPGQFAQVPEPASLVLLGLAVVLGVGRRRRR